MSLRGFHVVFISASALLAFALAAWCFGAEPAADGARRVAGVASSAAGIGLGLYEAWFLRKTRGLR